MTASLARPSLGDPVTETVRFNAPLFRALVERLATDERCVVLDLGAARTQTVALFGRYRCRLDIADLADGLQRLDAETDAETLHVAIEAMLPTANGEALDAVLCWDLLNYLDRRTLTALMSRIAARTKPGTLVHMLIVYAATHMPQQPGRIVPQADLSLVDNAVGQHARKAPRYTPADLTDCLRGFSMERAMLLGNGMQEILFRV